MCPGVLQTSSDRSPTSEDLPLVDRPIHLAAGHRDLDSLGVDPGVGEDLVALLEGLHAPGMSGDRALEDLSGPGQSLGVIHVGVAGEDHLAGREAEAHLPRQLQDVGQLVQEPHVQEGVFLSAVDQVDIHAHPAA